MKGHGWVSMPLQHLRGSHTIIGPRQLCLPWPVPKDRLPFGNQDCITLDMGTQCTTRSSSRDDKRAGSGFCWVIRQMLIDGSSNPSRIRKLAVLGFNSILLILIGWIGVVSTKAFLNMGRKDDIPLLILGLLICLGWMLWGILPALDRMIREPELGETELRRVSLWRVGLPFIVVELVLVTSVILFVLPSNPHGILKALLLPVMAHAVLLVRGPWLALMVIICFAIHFIILSRPGMDFFLEAVFTIVCVQMVVATERSYAEARRIANRLEAANAELAAHSLQAEELAAARERSRLAREVHDLIGHHLTVVRVQLEAALSIHGSDPSKAMEAVRNARECAGEGLREIRSSVESLRAGPLENRSLCEALLALVSESERAGQRVHLIVEGSEKPVSAATALTIYRAAQEALTNVRKHVPGARVTLEFSFLTDGEVILRVTDDGPGLPEDFSPGFGLTGLRERTALIGGSLVINQDSTSGFSFVLTLPA
jgi:signal transduction histidine kinase